MYTELRLRVKYFRTRSGRYSLHGYRYSALVKVVASTNISPTDAKYSFPKTK